MSAPAVRNTGNPFTGQQAGALRQQAVDDLRALLAGNGGRPTVLRHNSRNRSADVERLQFALNAFYGRPVLDVDGKFGSNTRRILLHAQRQLATTAAPDAQRKLGDGVGGQITYNALIARLSRSDSYTPPTPPTAQRVIRQPVRAALATPTREGVSSRTPRNEVEQPATAPVNTSLGRIDVQRTSAALIADIRRRGGRLSDQTGVVRAVQAAVNYMEKNPGNFRPYVMFNDMGLPGSGPRGYILNIQTGRVEPVTTANGRKLYSFPVAHGYGSGARGAIPSTFTNTSGHGTTILGLMVGNGSAPFTGTSGGRAYNSTKIIWSGTTALNSGLARDGKWTHGAPYVNHTSAGRSAGCPSVAQDIIDDVVRYVGNRGFGFNYHPAFANDRRLITITQR